VKRKNPRVQVGTYSKFFGLRERLTNLRGSRVAITLATGSFRQSSVMAFGRPIGRSMRTLRRKPVRVYPFPTGPGTLYSPARSRDTRTPLDRRIPNVRGDKTFRKIAESMARAVGTLFSNVHDVAGAYTGGRIYRTTTRSRSPPQSSWID